MEWESCKRTFSFQSIVEMARLKIILPQTPRAMSSGSPAKRPSEEGRCDRKAINLIARDIACMYRGRLTRMHAPCPKPLPSPSCITLSLANITRATNFLSKSVSNEDLDHFGRVVWHEIILRPDEDSFATEVRSLDAYASQTNTRKLFSYSYPNLSAQRQQSGPR